MKRKAHAVFVMILIASLGITLVPLMGERSGGQALAISPPPADFVLNSGRADVDYETVSPSACSFVNETAPLSCFATFWDNTTDLDTDVTHNELDVLFLGGTNCTAVDANLENALFNNDLISWQGIPGNAIHKTANKNFTIYSFEGNVPRLFVLHDGGNLFDHLEFNLKVPVLDPADSTLHVEANTNFCFSSNIDSDLVERNPSPSPVTMVFSIGSPLSLDTSSTGSDKDFGCVELTPEYSFRDVSSLCGSLGFGPRG
jgi:hypothetical protein